MAAQLPASAALAPLRQPPALPLGSTAALKRQAQEALVCAVDARRYPRWAQNWALPPPDPWGKRWSRSWFRENLLLIAVFSATGTLTVKLRRQIAQGFKRLGFDMQEVVGTSWFSFLLNCAATLPLYYTLLLVIGTLSGRHAYFGKFAMRMWHRLQSG